MCIIPQIFVLDIFPLQKVDGSIYTLPLINNEKATHFIDYLITQKGFYLQKCFDNFLSINCCNISLQLLTSNILYWYIGCKWNRNIIIRRCHNILELIHISIWNYFLVVIDVILIVIAKLNNSIFNVKEILFFLRQWKNLHPSINKTKYFCYTSSRL